MSGSVRWLAALGVSALALGAPAFGQRFPMRSSSTGIVTPFPTSFGRGSFNPNPYIAPGVSLQQFAFNTATLGRALQNVPPYALGYNPYTGGLPLAPGLSPYSLSTSPGYNPYAGGGASLSAGPYGGYSMSTAPGSSYSPYGGYGYGPPDSVGGNLQGLASYTDAAGKYWINIQQGRLLREQSRQSAIDTARKQVEYELWRESIRPTAPKMRDAEMATDLDRARKDPPRSEVWSGRSLNDLLRSINNPAHKLNRGPNLELPEETLKHINLTNSAGTGNVGMLKNGGKLDWPVSLQEPQFDKARRQITRNLPRAVDQLKDEGKVDRALLKDITSDYDGLNDILHKSADELSPAQYIEAKRYLNQMKSAVRALADPNAAKYFNNTWNAKGKNVAELVSHMTREGLSFAPAAPGDEAAYNALYQALRAFEAGVQTASR